MPSYPLLAQLTGRVQPANASVLIPRSIVPYLVDIWLTDYTRGRAATDIVETSADDFSYLFDVAAERLIAAWGMSRGRHGGARDRSRMSGHPLSAGPLYHRGHAIP